MNDRNIAELLKAASRIKQSTGDREKQRQSFTYGNTKIENRNITRESIEAAARALASEES